MTDKIGWTNDEATLVFFDEHEKLKSENKALKDSRDELLDFLKRVDRENWLDGDWWEDITPLIEKVEALKKANE